MLLFPFQIILFLFSYFYFLRFFVDVSCTKDRRFVTINSSSKTTSEVRYIEEIETSCVVLWSYSVRWEQRSLVYMLHDLIFCIKPASCNEASTYYLLEIHAAATPRLYLQTLFQHEVLQTISTLNAGCNHGNTINVVFKNIFGQQSKKIVGILALLITELSSSKIYKVGMIFCILWVIF